MRQSPLIAVVSVGTSAKKFFYQMDQLTTTVKISFIVSDVNASKYFDQYSEKEIEPQMGNNV